MTKQTNPTRDEAEKTAPLRPADKARPGEQKALDERARVNVAAPTYIRAVDPDHGEQVTFVPGELLPGWAVDALDSGRFEREGGAVRLVLDEDDAS